MVGGVFTEDSSDSWVKNSFYVNIQLWLNIIITINCKSEWKLRVENCTKFS